MRRLLSAVTVAVGTAAVLAVPVVGMPVAHAHPVTARVTTLAVPGVGAPRAAGSGGAVIAAVARAHTSSFDLVGATWRRGTLDAGTTRLQVRVLQHGQWSGWRDLGAEDGGADAGTPDAVRAQRLAGREQTASPMWVGRSDGVQARVVGPTRVAVPAAPAPTPEQLRLVLVDGGTSAADAHPQPVGVTGGAVAAAATGEPTILTRADWGADESLRRHACPSGPDYAPGIRMGFIHHTDNGNGYTRAQVPSIIRSIYAYHVESNGWCDVGYNFLVDRFGRIWEGRYGGITKAVIGAHTGGFNYDSFGVGMLGTFTSHAPTSALVGAVERVFAWKLGTAYRDPLGRTQMTAGSFSGSRYSTGADVRLHTVSGHRDADYTDCPGNKAYGELPSIRAAIRRRMGAGFVSPAVSGDSAMMGVGSFTITAGAIAKESWTLTATAAGGDVVATTTGSAGRSRRVAATWDLGSSKSGTPAPPGTYTLRLTATGGSAAAVPWQTTVHVTPPITLSSPRQVAFDAPVVASGRGIPGDTIDLTVTGAGGFRQTGAVRVSARGRWTSAAVAAARDLTWTAADDSVGGYTRSRTTRVAPAVGSPGGTSFVPAGQAVQLQGTALPAAATVHLVTQRGTAAPVTGAPVAVGADGSWATSFTPAGPTAFWIVDSRGLASTHHNAYGVGVPTAAAPGAGYAGRHVLVTGNAGSAPVPATLRSRVDGGAWTAVRTVTAAGNGEFAVRLPLPATATAVEWKVTTDYGSTGAHPVAVQPTFAPTATAPARVAWNAVRLLSGTAVPGDRVTVWTARPGDTAWTRRGRIVAAADSTWSFPLTFTRDTAWRITTPTGAAAGTTVVAPTLQGPHTVAVGQLVRLHGRAIPGRKVTVLRRLAGSTDWVAVTSRTASSDGTWTLVRHVRRTADYRVTSHRQTSWTLTVSVG